MFAAVHQSYDVGKHSEVFLLAGEQRIALKMRHYLLCQFRNASDFILKSFVRSIRPNRSALKVLLKQFKNLRAIPILTNGETGTNVPSESVSLTLIESDTETSFTVSVTRQIRLFVHDLCQIPACCGAHRFAPTSLEQETPPSQRVAVGSSRYGVTKTSLGI